MTRNDNPQAAQMADESMVRTLAAQAAALWPEERRLFERYHLPPAPRILDAGCGTGQMTGRLAAHYPGATLLGIDVQDGSLDRARASATAAGLSDRVRYEHRSIYATGLADGAFDLTVCRHVLQSIPDADKAIAELLRVTRRGGTLHLLVEDYGMIHFARRRLNPDEFWRAANAFGESTGTDLFVGRNTPGILHRLGLTAITMDYLVVDTVRTPRQTFADIWTAWRDGYADALAQHTSLTRQQALDHFNDMIETLRDPAGFGLWLVPVVSATVP
jgi:SAM-dependent methyltransferase